MNLVDLALVVGVVWRVTRLICFDTILDSPRGWVFEHGGRLGELVGCPWCASFWIAVITVGVVHGWVQGLTMFEFVGTICLASAVSGYMLDDNGVG